MDSELIFKSVLDEYQRASRNFNDYHSYHEGYAVIKEELDELWHEIMMTGNKRNMELELIQIMATSMRFLTNLIYKYGDHNGKRN